MTPLSEDDLTALDTGSNLGVRAAEEVRSLRQQLATHSERERLIQTRLRQIKQWDQLNPPVPSNPDLPWLKALVEECLSLFATAPAAPEEKPPINEELDELECTLEDEEAAHADTLRLWNEAKAKLAAAERRAVEATWRKELNDIAALVGRPGLSPDEDADGHIADSVRSQCEQLAAFDEALEQKNPGWERTFAASEEHHEEHHRSEEELTTRLAEAEEDAEMSDDLRKAADEFRNGLLSRADRMEHGVYPLWHGWAIYEAFVAGAKFAENDRLPRTAPAGQEKDDGDIRT